jgi:hypothetical protein
MRVSSVLALLAVLAVPSRAADPGAHRDPFQPAAAVLEATAPAPSCADVACVGLASLTLRALIVDTASPRALVEQADGRGITVRVGDTIAGRRVVAITRQGVALSTRGTDRRPWARPEPVLLALRR